jgi:endonuclease-3
VNLVLGIACPGQPAHGIGVDIHVHRVTNRWGYVDAPTPEKTMAQLQAKLPHRYWTEINRLLVPFGKFVCTGVAPRCSTCPLLSYCRQVRVTKHR